jgi:hypothetical protein
VSYSRIHHVTVPGLRLHLRRGDPNMLWLNGQDLVMLNDTAAEFIEAFIEVMSRYRDSLDSGRFKKEVAGRMRRRYPDVPEKTLVKDFERNKFIVQRMHLNPPADIISQRI